MTDAVALDLGGVLIDWDPMPAIAAGVGEGRARALLEADDFDFFAWNHEQDAGRPFAEAEAEVARDHPRWAAEVSAYFPNYARSLRGQVDGTVTVLRELADAGMPVFALTNWSAETFHHARERFDFLELFDDIVVSGAVGAAKPDPAVFAALVRRTGVPAGRTFFTDDSATNVEGALEFGLDAVRFTGPDQLRAELRRRGALNGAAGRP